MAINSIGGFNPYANGIGVQRGVPGTDTRPAAPQQPAVGTTNTSTPTSVAGAIKSDASARAAQVNSPKAPDGVDQELWSVLTKEERSYFVRAGAMGPLTYGRFTPSQPTAAAPLMRGGRLDIKA